MQIKFLKKIVELLIDPQAAIIVDLLVDKKDVNEFLIAKKMDLTINQTRNILYKLSDYGLVSFIRKRDKRKGWYIYFWTLNVYQSLNLLEEKLRVNLDELKKQSENRTKKPYYVCNTCSLEVNEDSALLNDFTCTECEEVYELADQSENLAELEKEIKKLERDLELVKFEKGIEGEKLEKKKQRKLKKLEKEKKEKKRIAREKAKKEKEKKLKAEGKTLKKSKKKVAKKKVVKKKVAKKKAVKKKTAKKPLKKKTSPTKKKK
jgi:transcription factor E